jgi:branched-chain amino acid transport system permease protein
MIPIEPAISGLAIGGLYATMAMGMSLSWRVLKVIDLSHLGFILLGAYLTYGLTTSTGLDPLATVLVIAPLLAALGAVLRWLLDRFRISEFHSLLVTFGLLIAIVQIVTNVWTADFRRLPVAENPYVGAALPLGVLAVPLPRLLAFAAGLAIAILTRYLLSRTYLGMGVRAAADDPAIAASFGVDLRRIAVSVAAYSAATAALAGALVSIGSSIFPEIVFEWIGIIFTVIILGGIGRPLGTLVAGAAAGAISGIVAATWSPALAPLVLFLVLIVALLVGPSRLLARLRA